MRQNDGRINNDNSKKDDTFVYSQKSRDNYLTMLEIMSKSTDDYLFLYEISSDKYWFYGDISNNYNVCDNGENICNSGSLMSITHSADADKCLPFYNGDSFKNNDFCNVDCRWIDKQGSIIWLNLRGTAIYDTNGVLCAVTGRVSEEMVRHLFNPLTGLFNRLKLMPDLRLDIDNNISGYYMIADVDDLSVLNLHHGREYGDSILKQLALLLEEHSLVRKVYHVDNNYFVALVNSSDKEDVNVICRDLRAKLSDKCTFSAAAVPMDKSIFLDEYKLYDTAKLILRKAKAKGSSSIEFFDEQEIKHNMLSIELLDELNNSVHNGFSGFDIEFQPQVKSGTYDVVSAEALLRYYDKSGKKVFPNDFIPLLEQSRLIEKVGLWVTEKALICCKKWRNTFPDFKVSVNFSPVQFRDEHLAQKVEEILKKTGMPGDSLIVEITESMNLNELSAFNDIVSGFKHNGVFVSVDDFGTGYSNLGYLKQLDVDEIKIDRMFISGIDKDTYNYSLLRNTVAFAKSSEIGICCEGVEESRELAVLENLSPDKFQGYLFDKPLKCDDFENRYINSEHADYIERVEHIKKIYEFKERMGVIHFNPSDILRETNVGLWVIRINEKEGYAELHVDETMERIMGIDKKYSPRECFEFWNNRISTDDKEYVFKNLKLIADMNKVVQLQYKWNHPKLSEVVVRSNGRRAEDYNGMIVIEGYHRILSNIEEV